MRTARTILASACAVLVACSEGLSVGEWGEAGTSQPPLIDRNVDLRMATLAAGTGDLVKVGDLVKLRVVTRRVCKKYSGRGPELVTFTGESQPDVLWLWTGREPGLSADSECTRRGKSCNDADLWAEESLWGRLGDKSFRKALIGRPVGEKFELKQGPDKEGYVAVPLYGFHVIFDNATLNDGRSHAWFPESQIAHLNKFDETQNIWAEVEILDACPGRLLRRRAQMGEYTVRWSALEGKCPAPGESVRLEIGPLRFSRYDPFQGSNAQWRYRYRQVRPPEKFPEEYGIKRPAPPSYEQLCRQKP